MSPPTPIDYDALAKQYGAVSSGVDYDALAKQYGATSSATMPKGPQLPVPQELQPGMVMTHLGPMRYSDAVQSQEPGIPEEAMSWGRSSGQVALDSARPAAIGAAVVAPMLTGGASLPVQAAVGAGSGASQSKLEGGSNTEAGIPAIAGGALPFLGRLASGLNPAALKASAGPGFSAASEAAGAEPVSVEGAGQPALAAKDLQDVGRTMPRVLQRFLQRVTAPDAADLSFDEARRFYSAAGELSANDEASYTPAMKRALRQFKSQLGTAIQQTADNAGVGSEYAQAMSDYAKAKRLEDSWDLIWGAAKKNFLPGLFKGLGIGAGGTAAGYGVYKVLSK